MERKIFKLTDEEINQQKKIRTKPLGISGETWEQAMRFTLKSMFRTMISNSNSKGIVVSFEVVWPKESEELLVGIPENIAAEFLRESPADFIETMITGMRELIRGEDFKI